MTSLQTLAIKRSAAKYKRVLCKYLQHSGVKTSYFYISINIHIIRILCSSFKVDSLYLTGYVEHEIHAGETAKLSYRMNIEHPK